MSVLSQERLSKTDSGISIYGNVWSIASLTNDPSAAIVAASSAPLIASLKHCIEVSVFAMIYCTVQNFHIGREELGKL